MMSGKLKKRAHDLMKVAYTFSGVFFPSPTSRVTIWKLLPQQTQFNQYFVCPKGFFTSTKSSPTTWFTL